MNAALAYIRRNFRRQIFDRMLNKFSNLLDRRFESFRNIMRTENDRLRLSLPDFPAADENFRSFAINYTRGPTPPRS